MSSTSITSDALKQKHSSFLHLIVILILIAISAVNSSITIMCRKRASYIRSLSIYLDNIFNSFNSHAGLPLVATNASRGIFIIVNNQFQHQFRIH